MDENKVTEICKTFFKVDPKPEQLQTLCSYMTGTDTILLAPTGFGKSIIYQAAPLLHDHDRYIIKTSNKSTTKTSTTTTATTSNSSISAMKSSRKATTVTSSSSVTTMRAAPLFSLQTGSNASSSSSSGSSLASLELLTTSAPEHSTPIKSEKPSSMIDWSDIAADELSSLMEEVTIHPSPVKEQKLTKPSNKKKFAQFIVIMPLVAMITEALANMKKMLPMVSAVHLTASTMEHAKHAVMIFTSPETILQGCGRLLLETKAVADNIKTVFVDEFHIIASWGLSSTQKEAFRESYGQLGQLRAFMKAPLVCLSATAPDDVIQTVISSLNLKHPKIISVNINKENISYHSLRVKGEIMADFRWLAQLLLSTPYDNIPRTLIFFINVNMLSDVYEYITTTIGQRIGDTNPVVAMFQLLTKDEIKQSLLSTLAHSDSKLKFVLCSSSLSMGMNLAGVEYVLHYGAPTQAAMFLQETGRAAREPSIHAHSILLKYPRMASGRKLDDTMKEYSKGEKCLRGILLSKFKCTKRPVQEKCCAVCEGIDCFLMSIIQESYDSSVTDSFSDSDSLASAGELEDLDDLPQD